MTCREVQRILPELLEGVQDAELGAHLRTCPACSELVSDLQFISSEARQLAASDEPTPELWRRLAAELRSEGIIREPGTVKPAPLATPRRGWSVWWLVPVAAALVVGFSYIISHRPLPTTAVNPPAVQAPAAQTAPGQPPQTVAQTTAAQLAPRQNTGKHTVEEAPPSADDQQFLSEVSQRAPSMLATYEDQLHFVNAYIQEAQAYLDRHPEDADARQHLMEAYRQKALLYQLALDHIQ